MALKPKNEIEHQFSQTRKAFADGARGVNQTYSHLAGQQLQSGQGQLMAQYRNNKRTIDDIENGE